MTTCSEQFNKIVKVTLSETQQIQDQTDGDKNIHDMDESVKSQNVFPDDNATIEKRYTATRIESRNFLSNIVYVELTRKTNAMKIYFFDVYFLMTKNLNPFSLDRNLSEKIKH